MRPIDHTAAPRLLGSRRVITAAALAFGAAAWLIHAEPAQALTVANHDQDTAMVVIIAGGEEQAYELAPGETVSDLCQTGCTAIFGNGEELTMTGAETVAIENRTPKVTSSR